MRKGSKLSLESRKKMSISRMGHFTSQETRKKISEAHKGKKFSPEHIEKMRLGRTGIKHTQEAKDKIRKNAAWGAKNRQWKGGITKKSAAFRMSWEYKQWRTAVFTRDNWTCQTCGVRGISLQAHHIKAFAKFPELRLEVSNGVTLCIECHKLTDSYLKKS